MPQRIKVTDQDLQKVRAGGWFISKKELERLVNLDLHDPKNRLPQFTRSSAKKNQNSPPRNSELAIALRYLTAALAK